ncbi:hypothetical protein [Actinomadura nitritigenes]|uniref:hypothetical protein n=1 Tax=Actinomadura nitritigenes TaxID=134602 RepID=UPI003D8F29D0
MIAYRGMLRMRAENQREQRRPAASSSSAARSASGGSEQVTYYSDISQNPDLAQYFGRRRDQPSAQPREQAGTGGG